MVCALNASRLEADVRYEIQPVKLLPGYFDLIYTVAEGPKITVLDIQFRGAVKIKPRKLAFAMKTTKRMWIVQSGVPNEGKIFNPANNSHLCVNTWKYVIPVVDVSLCLFKK